MSEQNPITQAVSEVQETLENEIQENSTEEKEVKTTDESSISEQKETPKKELTKQEKKLLKQLKLKVDGKEFDEELPFEIPEEHQEYMKKNLQMAKMGQKRAQENAQLQQEIKQFVEELRKNPRKILSDPMIGLDLKELAAQVIEDEIERSKKSPEQIEKEKLENELKALKEEREKEKAEIQKRELERLTQLEVERYDTQISTAIENSDLPKSPYVVKKMAEYLLLGLQNQKDLTAEDVLPLVKEEIQQDIKDMFSVMPEDVIEKIIGKETLGRLRKKNIAKVKTPQPVSKAIPETGESKKSEGKQASKKYTFKDLFNV